jgi:hypothetical protein
LPGVVRREVVALLKWQQRDGDDRDPTPIEQLDDTGALVAEIRDHEGHASAERLEVVDDRRVGEQRGQARRVELTGQRQARRRHGARFLKGLRPPRTVRRRQPAGRHGP